MGSAPPPPPDPLVGQVVAGVYRVATLIGSGGMGRVYRAEQLSLAKTVALKVIHPHLLGDESSVARFYTEVRAASRLNHPNSVAVLDFGRTENGLLYLVMEYLRGRDLGRLMYDEGPLPLERIVNITGQILAALGEAHDNGIVHRDLKPENVLVDRMRVGGDFVKVCDFGLAKIMDIPNSSITRPGIVCGTPDYMAPEQGRGDETDARSDLYSVGVVLFQMLTDRLPFEGENATRIVLAHLTAPVPDPRLVAPQRHIPAPLAALTMRALAKNADERFQTAVEFAAAVRDAWDGARSNPAQVATSAPAKLSCPSCGADIPAGARFCNECGARISGARPRLTRPPSPRSSPRPPPAETKTLQRSTTAEPPLVGRGAELAQIEDLRRVALSAPMAARIVGEIGIGKTRLLAELAERASSDGDTAVVAGPHASGAPVPYHTVAELVCGLVGVDEPGQLLSAVEQLPVESEPDPYALRGLRELGEVRALAGGLSPAARTIAVSRALSWASRFAADRTSSGRTVLLVDDLGRCDGLSRKAIGFFARELPSSTTPVLLVAAMQHWDDPYLPDDIVSLRLRGLTLDEIGPMVDSTLSPAPEAPSPPAADAAPPTPRGREFVPLLLRQLAYLGADADFTLYPRLADVIALRLERLPTDARRLLQAASIAGQSARLELVRAVLGKGADITSAIRALDNLGFASVHDGSIEISHPLVRDLAEASTPAAARRALHGRCLEWLTEHGSAALEERTLHAWSGDDPFGALLLLERSGDAAMRSANDEDAVSWLRRGLELARGEYWRGELDSADRAMVIFSRKLGEVLLRAGDVTGAEGVLREALDLAGRGTAERVRILILLARTSVARGRLREAHRLLDDALDGTEVVDRRVMADLWAEVAAVSEAEGMRDQTVDALARAAAMLDGHADSLPARIRILVTLAASQRKAHLDDAAKRSLDEAEQLATEAELHALTAAAVAARAEMLRHSGDEPGARRAYSQAAELAAKAGDLVANGLWMAASSDDAP